ncbi:MAG: hypothetical protein NUK65_02605 [Firmicutes bacterium]|nr:hypothetical protein [Bacillota bacterium]
MNYISINDYAKKHVKHNAGESIKNVKERLRSTVARQEKGASCTVCGQPIWALGSTFSGFDGCFSCFTGESDDSNDYEVY